MTDVSEQVAAIIAAAEQTAQALSEQAERRARERIAEADRAAEHRLKAAEADAQEIRRTAEARAEDIVREAQDEHRRLLDRADAATSDAMVRGEELSEALAQLGVSLQTNARRVLEDVRRAHAHLRAPLTHAEAQSAPRDSSWDEGAGAERAGDELELPRFLRRR